MAWDVWIAKFEKTYNSLAEIPNDTMSLCLGNQKKFTRGFLRFSLIQIGAILLGGNGVQAMASLILTLAKTRMLIQ